METSSLDTMKRQQTSSMLVLILNVIVMCVFLLKISKNNIGLIEKCLNDTEQSSTSPSQNLQFTATEQKSSSCGTQPDLCSQSTCCAARTSRAIDGTAAPSSAALTG